MPPETFAAYARASGLDLVALHHVFRCSYPAVALRLGEVLCAQPLAVVLYEREEDGDPATWERPDEAGRPAGYGGEAHRRIPRSCAPACSPEGGNGSPRPGKPLSSGSLAERAARSGETEYAEGDGIAVVAKPILWKGRLAKVAVVAVPWEHRKALAPQHGAAPWPGSEPSARPRLVPTSP